MSCADDLIRELLIAGLDDWMFLAQMGSIVKQMRQLVSEDDVRDLTCATMREMISSDLLRVGDMSEAGFVPWECDVDQIVERIDLAWRRIGRISLGDICWCETTKLGKERGAHLLASVGSSLDDD